MKHVKLHIFVTIFNDNGENFSLVHREWYSSFLQRESTEKAPKLPQNLVITNYKCWTHLENSLHCSICWYCNRAETCLCLSRLPSLSAVLVIVNGFLTTIIITCYSTTAKQKALLFAIVVLWNCTFNVIDGPLNYKILKNLLWKKMHLTEWGCFTCMMWQVATGMWKVLFSF